MIARSRRGRGGWLVVALVVVVAVAVGGWFVGSRVRSSEQAASEAAPPARSVVTVEVERRLLTASVVTRGDVRPATATAVEAPAGSAPDSTGSAVVTGVFIEVGDSVVSGDVVVEVAGRPVFVLGGEVPAYRSLQPGMVGRDVEQLQAALAGSGCDVDTSGTYDEATKACVAALYADAGYQVQLSSETEAADLTAARAAVSDAADAVFEAESALAEASEPPARSEVVAAEQAVAAAERDLAAARRERGVAVAAARADVESALAGLNAVLVGANLQGGSGGGAGGGEAPTQETGDTGSGGGAGGVGARDEAAAAVELARGDLERKLIEQDGLVTAASEELERARADLADLQAAPDLTVERRAVERATARADQDRAALADLEAVSGPTVPLGEVVFVTSLPATVDSLNAVVGGNASGDGSGEAAGPQPGTSGGGDPLAVLSSTGLQVELEVQPSDIALVAEGMEVELLDESSGATITGTVSSLASQPTRGSDGTSPGYPAVVTADDIPAEWTGRNIRVTFVAAATDGEALVVPVAAVWSDTGGGTHVEVRGDDGSTRRVDVSVVLTADGYSAVEPAEADALTAGDEVVVGR